MGGAFRPFGGTLTQLSATRPAEYVPGAEVDPVAMSSGSPATLRVTPGAKRMATFLVEGGQRLSGRVRPAGNKNAALPCLAATILADGLVVLENVPRIRDVETFLEILSSLGAVVDWTGPNEVSVDPRGIKAGSIDRAQAERIRASLLLAGPLLARFGHVALPPPGGDVIGRRRMDTHFIAFEALGAEVTLNGGFTIEAHHLRGTDVFLDEPSVTASENAVMAAVLAEGHTRIRNAAAEPHVQDLCRMLVSMGAHIEGIGTHLLEIEGVKSLSGTRFRVGADHIETGSFIGLAAVTCSRIVIEQAPFEHLDSTLLGFRRLGVTSARQGDDLVVHGDEEHIIRQDAFGHVPKIDDGPWPAFPADLTSIALVTATQCRGTVLIHEKMFESRMYFTDKLVGLGASIILCDPHRAVVVGPSPLTGGVLESPDIRAGMALLIAALGAEGTSRIGNIGQIERGYERIDERLRELGAHLERLD
jgi:UDP-N-acetylglucosamine 1-carboxyvinyltransferase